ncbi:multidrug effflux MFS transporter [Runella sp. SP2]|uniref:multidrug effflux MFS transporter n=1 Tax=Runella sp. SP2 TaxID=2268026 RepID=UPI000F0914AC|nr:multidrug effflux MFS transporter [Runella sp. SP2]AYQ31849.1 MFS transporter [Runella sp. SP2]
MSQNRFLLLLILGLLSAIGPFSIDSYLSGFPSIATDLKVSIDEVSYSLSSFFIGISLGQMLYGPLLDRFGRKKPLLIGLVIYILASLGCVVVQSIEMLIVLRFFQAIGGCVGIIAPRAIVRDTFPVQESAKIFSTLMLILGVSPIIAPTFGGYMVAIWGWHSVFIVQALVGFILFVSVLIFLPESKEADTSVSLHPKAVIPSFWGIFRTPHFFTYAFAGSLISGSVYAYISGSPFVFMELFKATEQHYGWIFGLLAGGLILSSQLNNLVLRKTKSEKIVNVVIPIQVAFGLLLVSSSLLDWLNLYNTIFLLFLYFCCQGFSFPNTAALSLAPFSKQAGSASALMGALQMGIGALAAALVGYGANGTSLPMTSVMAGCAVIGFLVFRIGGIILEKT